MECPGCHQKLDMFSKSVNRFGKKTCPQCGKAFKLKIDFKKFVLIGLPLMFVANFALAGIAKSVTVSIVAGLTVLMSMKAVETVESR